MQDKDITNPLYVGPGVWFIIHKWAINCKNTEDRKRFCRTMKKICDDFPCINCSNHCKDYMEKHPIESYIDVKMKIDGVEQDVGLFFWTWKFHNAVNERLKKDTISLEKAYRLYTVKPNVCSIECMKSKQENKDTNEIKKRTMKIIDENLSGSKKEKRYKS